MFLVFTPKSTIAAPARSDWTVVSATSLDSLYQQLRWSEKSGDETLARFIVECLKGTPYENHGYHSVSEVLAGDVSMLRGFSRDSHSGLQINAIVNRDEVYALTFGYHMTAAPDSLLVPLIVHAMRTDLVQRHYKGALKLKGISLVQAWEETFGSLKIDEGIHSREHLLQAMGDHLDATTADAAATSRNGFSIARLLAEKHGAGIDYTDWLLIHPSRRLKGVGRYAMYKMLHAMSASGAKYWLGRTVLPLNESLFKNFYHAEIGADGFASWTDKVKRIAFVGALEEGALMRAVKKAEGAICAALLTDSAGDFEPSSRE